MSTLPASASTPFRWLLLVYIFQWLLFSDGLPPPTTLHRAVCAAPHPGVDQCSSYTCRVIGVSNPRCVFATPVSTDAQTITLEALESVKAAFAISDIEHKAESKKKALPRRAPGHVWEDPTLVDWPESGIPADDFRLFYGDLGNEVNGDVLSKAFQRFPSFNIARVVRDKRMGKTERYGFVSFANTTDLAATLKEMNGKYVGNMPIKLRKSNWKERTYNEAAARQRSYNLKKPKLSKKSVLHK